MIGNTLSHYAIEAELGRGGMGIVYKARDTKLDREVAIKVLPSAALASADDRERFYREAKSAAALNHPNIAQVYQIDEAVPSDAPHGTEPSPFIAMEYIAGGTLQDKIKEKPLSLPDAVKIASQVAEALKAAHAKDIVHRDIKSANVMITEDGIAKVLDFGLAKTNQSTMLTRMGSTLGTVAYMSPEQARGQEVDGRTDLYSLGTMLYEMIAGRLPFAGEYEQAVVYSILNEPPEPLTSLRTGVPMDLERIVNKLLAKDADYRFQTATDLLVDLKSVDLDGSGYSRRSMPAFSTTDLAVPPQKKVAPTWVYGAVAGALLIGAVGAWMVKPAPVESVDPVISFPLPLEHALDRTGRRSVAISPDGQFMAYITQEGIRMQRMNDLGSSTLLVDLEQRNLSSRALFFSHDSRWLVFEDDQNDRLMRVDMSGSSPVRIADLPGSMIGGSWAATGDIYLGLEDLGIGRIAQGSGTVEIIHAPDSQGFVYLKPSLLPDGRTVLFTKRTEEQNAAALFDLTTKEERTVLTNAAMAEYSPTGHLVFANDRTLFANPFDPDSEEWSDTRVPLVENVKEGFRGGAHFDLSAGKTLIYAIDESGSNEGGHMLGMLSREGDVSLLTDQRKSWAWPDINSSGTTVVVEDLGGDSDTDLWTINVTSGEVVRLTSNGKSSNGVWSPDGTRIAHADFDGYILARYVNDASRVDTLYHAFGRPTSWSSDGRFLFFDASDGLYSPRSLKVLDLETGEARLFPESQTAETLDTIQDGNISPDGRWVAYEWIQNAPGIYVVPFPSGGDPRLISSGVGFNPKWSADGTSIYYQNGNTRYSATAFNTDTGVAQLPREFQYPSGVRGTMDFAVHPDGRVVAAVRRLPDSSDVGAQPQDVLGFVIGFDRVIQERAGVSQ